MMNSLRRNEMEGSGMMMGRGRTPTQMMNDGMGMSRSNSGYASGFSAANGRNSMLVQRDSMLAQQGGRSMARRNPMMTSMGPGPGQMGMPGAAAPPLPTMKS